MSVKIHAPYGLKEKTFYRIVVADSRMPRDGRFYRRSWLLQPTYQP